MKKLFFALPALLACAVAAHAQDGAWFVDGYHGGIYGHYPVEWQTRFMTDQLAGHPEWRIGLEIEPETWDTVKVRTPQDYADFRRIASNKRIEFTNPTYAQPYCYNISGESLIRQFEYGIRKTREHFPDVEFTTYSVEEPCFTSCLPQILSQFGFRYAVLKSPDTCWGGYMAPYGGQLVNWVGPDGTRLLAVPRYAAEALEDNSVWQTKAWGNRADYLAACRAAGIENPVGMTYQDAGWKGGPWLGSGEDIRGGSKYATWREYIEEVSGGETDDDYHMSQEDVRTSLMWGSQVLQRIAQRVRKSENSVTTAEKMAALALLAGVDHNYDRAAIHEAWRTLMLAQHHDSWIVPYNDLHGKGSWADAIRRWTVASDEISAGVIAGVSDDFASLATSDGDDCLTLFNTMGTSRREVVSIALPKSLEGKSLEVYDAAGERVASAVDASGKTLTVEAHVPAFGYATLRIATTARTPGGHTGDTSQDTARATNGELLLENDMYRMVFDIAHGGVIKSLVAKRDGNKEFAANGEYSLGELRGHFYDEGRFRSSTESPASPTILADNDLEKSVRIEGFIAGHPFTQIVTIRKGDPRIDFTLDIDWQGNPGIGEYRQDDAFRNNRRAFYDDRFKLNVLFPTALDEPALYKDAPFDVCESSDEDTFYQTWNGIKHNIVLHWVDLAEKSGRGHGLALLADHTTSYSHGRDFPLALTVQFSGNGLWGRDYGIDGPSHMAFAVVPHSGKWDEAGVQRQNQRWNEPLVHRFHRAAGPEYRSLVDVAGSGYEISAAYPLEEGVLVRLYNTGGDGSARKIRLGFRARSIRLVDLRGNHLAGIEVKQTHHGSEAVVRMPRFGIRTLIIEP